MFCRKCGSELRESAEFCLNCGTKIEMRKTLNAAKEEIHRKQYKVNSSQQEAGLGKTSKGIYISIVVMGIIIVLLIAIVAILMTGKTNGADTDTLEAETTVAETQEEIQTEELQPEENIYIEIMAGREYVFPTSDSEYLSMSDLEGLTKEECIIARNEFYARRGRIFTNEELKTYFEACSWYQGTVLPEDFSEAVLNEYEIANIALIVQYEEEQGF